MGGGVVAEFSRGFQKPTRFSGGGVVPEFFRVSESRRDSVGGGEVVAEFFRALQKQTRFSVGGGSSRIFPWSPVVAVVSRPEEIYHDTGVAVSFFRP